MNDANGGGALVRIGELARRAGIPPATLRAWERRYGIVSPQRTESGYRLYSELDERRLKRMVELIADGAAPAQAAARVEAEGDGGAPDRAPTLVGDALVDELYGALTGFDEATANRAFDRAISAYSVDGLVAEVVLPLLRRLGTAWESGEVAIEQEHFASNVMRGRLMALARGWGGGVGPLALLACPPGEEHDLGLVCFGLMLRDRGFRVALLGADTPLSALEAAAAELDPSVVVLASTNPDRGVALADAVGSIRAPVLLGGGAAEELREALEGAELLPGEIVEAAEQVAATVRDRGIANGTGG